MFLERVECRACEQTSLFYMPWKHDFKMGDSDKGENIFVQKCTRCHAVEKGCKQKIRSNLRDLFE